MKFLLPGLKGKEPLMIDPNTAFDLYRKTENLGMVDKLVQMVAERPAPSKTGMVAVIPLMGVIGMNLSPLEKALGGVDLMDFRKAWKAAEADPNVSEIWMLVDSPGGSARGVEETANMVRNTAKPTTSFNLMSASAGYYIASAADRALATPSSIIGSIGVRLVVEDWSKAYENAGVKIISITSGDLKGGADGSPVTDAELADMVSYVEELGAQFRADVLKTRTNVPAEAMRGQVFTGRKAVEMGLITGLYDTLEEALKSSSASTARVSMGKAKGKGAMASMSCEIEDSVYETLTPRQREMADNYCDVVETFGEFDQSSGPDGAHYVAESPFKAAGLACQNCVFYRGPRGCALVSGDIDPNGVCKLWVIPGVK